MDKLKFDLSLLLLLHMIIYVMYLVVCLVV